MASEKETAELNAMAFEIYKDRVAMGAKCSHDQEALAAFKMAEAFVKVRTAIAKGDVKPRDMEASVLSNCRAPNLRKTHPYNLVSQVDGDLARVKQIHAWLEKNPTPETEPQELVHRLNRAFSDLGWDLPAVNVARQIFPAYASN
jgi:hypothetical protein